MPFGSPRLYLAATLYSRVNILLVAIDSTVWTPVYSDQGLSRDGDLRSAGSLIQILSICACFARCTGAAPTFFYFCAVPLVHVFLICRHLLLTINLFAAYMTLYAAFSLESSSSSPPLSWLLGYDGRPPPPRSGRQHYHLGLSSHAVGPRGPVHVPIKAQVVYYI